MPQYQDEVNDALAQANRKRINGSSICFGTDSPSMPTGRHTRVTKDEVAAVEETITVPDADYIRSKNSTSHICFGSDSPAAQKTVQGRQGPTAAELAATAAAKLAVPSPHTMREKMFGGHRDEMSWNGHGGASPLRNHHAPLHPNPEMRVATFEQNRGHNTTSQIVLGTDNGADSAEEPSSAGLGGLISQHRPPTRGTTAEEAQKFAQRMVVASPHTAKQKVLGDTNEPIEQENAAPRDVQRTIQESHVVLSDGVNHSPMATHATRAKMYGAAVSSETEHSREVLVSSAAANKARFEQTTLSLW
jgi:hypothetical protein